MGNLEACMGTDRKEGGPTLINKGNSNSSSSNGSSGSSTALEIENEKLQRKIEELEQQMKNVFRSLNHLNEEWDHLKKQQEQGQQGMQKDKSKKVSGKGDGNSLNLNAAQQSGYNDINKTRQVDTITSTTVTDGKQLNGDGGGDDDDTSERLSEYTDMNSSSSRIISSSLSANDNGSISTSAIVINNNNNNSNPISAEKIRVLSSLYSSSIPAIASTSPAIPVSPYSSPYQSMTLNRSDISTPPTALFGKRKYSLLDEHLLAGSISTDSYALALSKMAQNDSPDSSAKASQSDQVNTLSNQ